MRVDARPASHGMVTRFLSHRRGQRMASPMVAMTIFAAGISLAPPAVADSADSLRSAVKSARSASCEPLRSNPLVEQAAESMNHSTDVWLNQDGRSPPEDDPLPLLNDLGYGGKTAILLQGAAPTAADAIKQLVIQGYLNIPDCSLTEYGASLMKNHTTDYILVVTILAA